MLQAGIPSNKDLQGAIVKTIAFFDLFDYPLTDREAWQWLLMHKCGFSEVHKILNSGQLDNVENRNGFYFLRGREEILEKRFAKYNYTERKFRRAVRIARLFRLIPWIKMIAVGNNIGAHNLSNDGDIDFFIVTDDDRIWISRFFSVLIVKILGLRPRGADMKDKICLSFFVSENSSDLEKLMIDEDIYFVYWLAGLTPIFKKDDFDFSDKNKWIGKYLPNLEPEKIVLKRKIEGNGRIIFKYFGGLEFLMKKAQLKVLPEKIKESMDSDPNIIVNDRILKFHLNDRRRWFRDEWKKKIYGLHG